MTTRHITAVALKFAAVYLWLQAIVALESVRWYRREVAVGNWPVESVRTTIAAIALGGILLLVLGLFAWSRANRLAAFVPSPPPDALPGPIAPGRLEEIALRALGVAFAVGSLEPFVRHLVAQHVDMQQRAAAWQFSWPLLGSAAGLAFGLVLACRTRAVINALNRLAARMAPDGARAESGAPPA